MLRSGATARSASHPSCRGWDVAKDDVFARHQLRIDPIAHDEAKVEDAIRDLALQARYYKRLIDPAAESHAQTRAGLQRLARWGAQTAHAVLMVALDLHAKDVISVQDLRRVMVLIESFFVRRQLARIPTNALNRAAHRQAARRRVVRRCAAQGVVARPPLLAER